MKRPILGLILILALASMACSVTLNMPQANAGPSQTFTISEARPDSKEASLTIGMGGGKLDIRPGGEKLVEGTVQYNVAEWKPIIQRSGSDVSLSQNIKDASFLGGHVVNNWDLRLGTGATDLTIQAGAYEGNLDLSGVPLTNLSISDGASKAIVLFDKPNPEVMSTFAYSTGASNIDLEGLLNANFDVMNFKGGAGNYTLDFSGKNSREVQVFIDSGLGNITIKIPKGINAQINVSGGLNNVSTQGTWTIEGQQYRSSGAEGPLVKIQVNVGVGNLQLENK